MKLFSIPDVESFLNLVKKSQGDVTLHLPDGNQVNLKQSHDAQTLFQIIYPGQSGLDIHLSNSADTMGFATLAIQSGVDAKTVSSILGHYSAGFTLDTYTHVTGNMQKEAAKRVGGLIAQAV